MMLIYLIEAAVKRILHLARDGKKWQSTDRVLPRQSTTVPNGEWATPPTTTTGLLEFHRGMTRTGESNRDIRIAVFAFGGGQQQSSSSRFKIVEKMSSEYL
jgi:hypothetical protein